MHQTASAPKLRMEVGRHTPSQPRLILMSPLQTAPGLSPSRDVELLSRIAAGDERALGELYDSTSALAFSLAMALLRDPADAEEAVGDAFAQIWRTAREFNENRGSLQAWVTTVVRSRALDRLRARRRTERVVLGASDIAQDLHQSAEDSAPTPDVATESAELGKQVAAAIAALTPAQQEALRLAYFEGLSQSEIAEHLREPLGTVKTRMRAALIKLREMLAPMRERGEL